MNAPQFTLYLFGSSVPWGFPYAPTCDIGTIVAQSWSGSVGGAPLVVRNEARYGAPSRYALERIRSVTQQPHRPNSALALVYSGNNEFLHLAPGHGATQGWGPALMTPEEHAAIIDQHRANLEAGVLALRRAHIEPVLATIPTNLRDWPPTYSALDAADAADLVLRYQRAQDDARAGRTEQAVRLLRELLAEQGRFAQAHFLLGRLYLHSGRPDEARWHLVAANDCDGRPLRATTDINRTIRSLADTRGVRLLDVETAFITAAGGVCGRGDFWDDCHPTLEGYRRIAALLNDHVADLAGTGATPRVPPVDDVRAHHGIDAAFDADVLWRIGMYYYKHSSCWDSALTLEVAEEHLRRALELTPTSIEVHIALALVLAHRGDRAETRELLADALEFDRTRALWLLHGPEARAHFTALDIDDAVRWALGRAPADTP
ncbi:tetratricopeptide repeat protein [Streptomyces mirabilis]|uniref:tetratricopeptide repeat protein n=1 Tax=Streptomyces mirabilis TaxID=68239 RepID=UPI0036883B18